MINCVNIWSEMYLWHMFAKCLINTHTHTHTHTHRYTPSLSPLTLKHTEALVAKLMLHVLISNRE